MSVKSFECAIARSQIGRYLAGDPVGDEAMRQLEAHISGCSDCQRLIDGKREELLGPLAQAPTAAEAVSADSAETIARRAAAASGYAVIGSPEPSPAEIAEPLLVGAASPNPAPRAAPGPTPESLGVTAAWRGAKANPAVSRPEGAPVFGASSAGPAASVAATKTPPAKFGGRPKFALPKLVRDVPEEEPAAPFGPAPFGSAPFGSAPIDASPSDAAPKPERARPANRSLGKAAMYGGALVLVLGAMSLLGDPTSLFGGKAVAAEPGAKMKADATAKAKPAPKRIAHATGVRRSALGVPITDAVDSPSVGTAAERAPKAPTLVARTTPKPTAKAAADPADLGPLEFDPTIDASGPETSVAAGRPISSVPPAAPRAAAKRPAAKRPSAKRAGAKRTATKRAGSKRTVPAVVSQPSIVIESDAAATTKPMIAKPVAAKPAVKRPAAKTTRAKAPISKPAARKVKRPRPSAPRPASSVIRVYDENGKPIN